MLPAKVKDIRLYNEANSYQGIIAEMTIPKIVMLTEDWRGGGMIGSIPIFHGVETPEFEFTLGGHNDLVVTQAGLMRHDGSLLRAIAAVQAEDGSPAFPIEAVMRGRHQEIDFGTFKPKSDTEVKIKTTCSYYKLIANGRTLYEIDIPGGVFLVDGVDRWADIRAALDG